MKSAYNVAVEDGGYVPQAQVSGSPLSRAGMVTNARHRRIAAQEALRRAEVEEGLILALARKDGLAAQSWAGNLAPGEADKMLAAWIAAK